MTATHQPDVTDRFCSQLIRRTARSLVDDGTFPQSDLEDVSQDLLVALFEQAGNFDAEKATWSTFVKKVVGDAAISLRRREGAKRRTAPSEVTSLATQICDGEGQPMELAAGVSEEEFRTGQGLGFVSHTDQVDTALDVQAVERTLPADLKEISHRLKTQSMSEVSRELGLSRTTLARRVDELREHFRRAGFGS